MYTQQDEAANNCHVSTTCLVWFPSIAVDAAKVSACLGISSSSVWPPLGGQNKLTSNAIFVANEFLALHTARKILRWIRGGQLVLLRS
jgi:hypothetical protein